MKYFYEVCCQIKPTHNNRLSRAQSIVLRHAQIRRSLHPSNRLTHKTNSCPVLSLSTKQRSANVAQWPSQQTSARTRPAGLAGEGWGGRCGCDRADEGLPRCGRRRLKTRLPLWHPLRYGSFIAKRTQLRDSFFQICTFLTDSRLVVYCKTLSSFRVVTFDCDIGYWFGSYFGFTWTKI